MYVFRFILIFTTFVFVFLSIYAFSYRKSRGALVFSALMLAGAFYSLGYSFEIASSTVDQIRFWLRIEYIGIPAIPTLWLIFALQFTGNKKWLSPPLIALLAGISFTTFLIHYTNDWHHWYYREIAIDHTGPFPLALLSKGPWYWVHIAYSNLVILIGNLLFIDMYMNTTLLYRKQAMVMLIGSLGPWTGHLVYIFGLSPYNLDMSPIAMVIAGIIFSWGMFHYHILDLVPIAAEHVFQSLSEGVIILDRKKRVINYNPAVSRIHARFNPESIGKQIDRDFGEFSRKLSPLITGKSDITILTFEIEGKLHTFQVTVSPVYDKRNRANGWITIFNDVTRLEKIEQALRDNERKYESLNATKDKFFRIISHDLKNPFQQLLGLTDILQKDLPNLRKDELTRIIGMIHSSAETGNKLLENLLIWSNAQTDKIEFKPEPLRLNDLVNQVIRFTGNLADNKNINLEPSVPRDLIIHSDRNMLDLILRNLITNAIKFTRRNGNVKITAGRENGNIIISVKDNGVGIPKDKIDSLFKVEKVYSTMGTEKEKGTGLGLLLCKEFVEKNNGTITVDSEPGRGSEFKIIFPAHED